MKGWLSGIVIVMGMGISAVAAFAQDAVPPLQGEDALKAFREKMEQAEKSSVPTSPQLTVVDEVPSPIEPVLPPTVMPADDPLGAAANLPVDGSAPPGLETFSMKSPEELQAELEAEREEQRKKLEEDAFDMALRTLLPMKPGQIRKTLDAFKDSREAAETPIVVPEPKQEVQIASLDTRDAPVVVKTSPNYVTTVTLLDQTGAPWPIMDVSWAGAFMVTPPEEGGHVIRITPQSAHGAGNISIRMVDMITPITMQLRTGLDTVHYRLDVRLPRPGPLAKTPIIESGGIKTVAGRDDQMVGILDGIAPGGAEKLKVEGVDGRTSVWKVADKMYLRTPLTLLSPGWDSSMSSAEGMNVYTLAKAPVILLSDEGRMVRAHIASDEESP